MLRSMTGFGKGEAENSLARIYIEIKSLNHKYFDIISKMPPGFLSFEDEIKSVVQKRVSRGRVNLFLEHEDLSGNNSNASINIHAARRYVKLLRKTKKELGLAGEITIQQAMAMPGVVTFAPQKPSTKQIRPLIKKALSHALEQLLESKKEEGHALKKHLLSMCQQINTALVVIKQCASGTKKEYQRKLKASIKKITKKPRIQDTHKIEEEAAIFVRNCDITEEIHRLDAHIVAFSKAALNHAEVGRRLDFIAQEMSREANTIGAKANNFRIAKEVIKIKSIIEKIREQTQNVE